MLDKYNDLAAKIAKFITEACDPNSILLITVPNIQRQLLFRGYLALDASSRNTAEQSAKAYYTSGKSKLLFLDIDGQQTANISLKNQVQLCQRTKRTFVPKATRMSANLKCLLLQVR